jgi:hypothetical protein
MAKSSVKHFYTATAFEDDILRLESETESVRVKFSTSERQYHEEIERTHVQFARFEEEHLKDYERRLGDVKEARKAANDQFALIFRSLDDLFVESQKQMTQEIAKENETYHFVLNAFEDLRKDAKATYDALCVEADRVIEKEVEMHRRFVAEEDAEYEAIKTQYAEQNNARYDQLLWAMEKSRNALENLKSKLSDQAFQDTKLENQTILYLIEQLRETKNKITHLFKTTTGEYAKRRDEIDRLSKERQIPHSVVNQDLIDAYVEQIDLVEEKRRTFANLVREDLKTALDLIGPKLIEADRENRRLLVEKYALQYEIVQSKAEFLLRQNDQMADLLIAKYQSEIKKLKIDSFRRVEEIKLTYSLPSSFSQNSINLYSNFAFYVNEALDSIDLMLSDFLQSIQSNVDHQSAYLYDSARVFEEYKINIHVMANTITNKMTDLLLEIDNISKEIVLLESKNRLEIAEARKAMEHADITSDYEKAVAKLDNDYFLADYQHDLNLKRIKNDASHRTNLLQIKRQIESLEQAKQTAEADLMAIKKLNLYERDIHDGHFDYELALAELDYRYLAERTGKTYFERKIDVKRQFLIDARHLSQVYRIQEERTTAQSKIGGDAIVDYVHAIQTIIDRDRFERSQSGLLIESHHGGQLYLRTLYFRRQDALAHLSYRARQAGEAARRAIRFFHRPLFQLTLQFEADGEAYLRRWKKALIRLSPDTSLQIADAFYHRRFDMPGILAMLESQQNILLRDTIYLPDAMADERIVLLTKQSVEQIVPALSAIEDALAKSANGAEKAIRSGLIRAIEALEFHRAAQKRILDDLCVRRIEKDVLDLLRIEDAYAITKQQIESFYDEALARAAKHQHSAKRVLRDMNRMHDAFEATLKDRVYRLNERFLAERAKETKLLHYFETELDREIRALETARDRELARLDEQEKHAVRQGEARWLAYKKGFEAMKTNNYDLTDAHNRHLDRAMGELLRTTEETRRSLTLQFDQLPKQLEKKLADYEAEKTKLVMEREALLQRTYAQIEETKYLSRPKYVQEMEAIKARLQSDYTARYREIGEAERRFLEAQKEHEAAYVAEFERFRSNQAGYQGQIGDDKTLFAAFDDWFETSDKLTALTKDVFQSAYAKSASAREAIRTKETDVASKEQRILDA